ncbi:MAG: hypothetical protein SGARI_008294, partial [Bacillariaceae sp.]
IQEKFDPLIDEFNEFKTHRAAGLVMDEYPYIYLGGLYEKFLVLQSWRVSAGQTLDSLKENAAEDDVERAYSVVSLIRETAKEVHETSQLCFKESMKRQDERLKAFEENRKRLIAEIYELCADDSDEEDSDDEDSDDEDSDEEDKAERCQGHATFHRDKIVEAKEESRALENVA